MPNGSNCSAVNIAQLAYAVLVAALAGWALKDSDNTNRGPIEALRTPGCAGRSAEYGAKCPLCQATPAVLALTVPTR